MTRLVPRDPGVLADAVTDSLVVAADEKAQAVSIPYWHHSRPYVAPVRECILAHPDFALRKLGTALVDRPCDSARYWALNDSLKARISEQPSLTADLVDLAWQAECASRLGFHLGRRYTPDSPDITWKDLAGIASDGAARPDGEADVLVVVPLRDRDPEGPRLRNTLACLAALRNQSLPRESYRVTVVECDTRPRWRDLVSTRCDHYVFAEHSGPFNKSWAVNVGVRCSPGDADVICILDGDVLADREFIRRNRDRFLQPGVGGHLPYRNMLCLDGPASAAAIDERVHRGSADVELDTLRGFEVRRPPGCCVWVRSEVFARIGGMDERYEGWGGEDQDFAFRVHVEAPFHAYDDVLLHLLHPPSSALIHEGSTGAGGMAEVIGMLPNSLIPPMSWSPSAPTGDPYRFRTPFPQPEMDRA